MYLDDADHYALSAKFCRDWQGQTVDWSYPDEWSAMDTQKKRDAEVELTRWLSEQHCMSGHTFDPTRTTDADRCVNCGTKESAHG